MSFPRFLSPPSKQDGPPANPAKAANPGPSGSSRLAELAALAARQSQHVRMATAPKTLHEAVDAVFPGAKPINIVEAAFKPVVELVSREPRTKVSPVNPEFPSCPECKVTRYWIAPSGKVVCGKCGETRFLIAHIEYHPVQ